ncbi:uncharacterized protein LOC122364032 [Amphibalanus amphitrite]|uniref:uncharacterized protein LOC122364032 n=1 Tax=Amphibalanus amphitrite TaxID=1232801 RepID=UPI001C90D3E3|nr:uncharacterized protein LOC122364032 [Amphibalanus amphitrite]XP_043189972.1 uncharacterized protein LOC122364032 [Amphibalanus amphitrite]
MLRSAGPVLLLLLAVTAAQSPNCDIGQPEALSDCVKQLLEGLRNDVHQSSDPLRLPGSTKQDGRVTTTVSDILIHGLSAYNIDHLNVEFPEGGTRLNVQATISWPRLRGNGHANAKAERRIFRKKLRASASADVEVRVSHPVGSLDVVLEIDVHPNGTIAARPLNTAVSVTLGDIDVDVHIGGLGGIVNRLIGDPVSKIATAVAEHNWKRSWRAKAERKAKEALEKAIVEKLGVQLSELLHV